jgi:hypothetical protein
MNRERAKNDLYICEVLQNPQQVSDAGAYGGNSIINNRNVEFIA